MNGYQSILIGLMATMSVSAYAVPIDLCVYDIMGTNGDTMAVAKDYALAAKQWDVEIRPKVYLKLEAAQSDFEQKKCRGLVADNFATKKYNNFMGTVGAIGAIPNYSIAQKVLAALGSPKLAAKLKNKEYEVVGYMPFGLVYFISKDRNIDSLQKLNGKRLGILASDPSQRRMAQKVGMKPVVMTFDNAASKFRAGEFDIVPAPLVVYQPFEVEKVLGSGGGIANYPLAFMSMNFILAQGDYPENFAQKSRQWFSEKSTQYMKTVLRWDNTVPKRMIYEIPEIDRSGYDLLLSQMRKEFVDNKTYDPAMIVLIRHLRCAQDPAFIECKK
ncbi:putative solute-binding protein [Acinetobacter puyangensis]|uniref:putative solute-binding protein n=1 Tax=Acinetobacter puyangensis TaxID=1096779 RepID=UPI003A4D77C0